MATADDIALVREYVNEPDVGGTAWTDVRITVFIDGTSTLTYAAADIWAVKAGQAAGLVNVTESGSSRNLGDLLKHAQLMEAHYRKRGDAETAPIDDGPVIRSISRVR